MKTLKRLVLSLLLITYLSGCVQHTGFDINRMFAPGNDAAEVNAMVERFIAEGDALAALELIDENGSEIETFSRNRKHALNLLYQQASRLETDQKFLQAGVTYRQVIDYLSASKSVGSDLEFSHDDVYLKRELCAEKLLQSGLISYRSGDLEAAIEIWSKIRTFHPGYKASQLAISTTRTQLKKLDTLN